MTTLAAAPRAAQRVADAVPAPPPRWDWRSGPCSALDHHFEVLLEPQGAADHMRSLVAPFLVRKKAASGRADRLVRYTVRSDPDGRFTLRADDERLASGRALVDLLPGFAWHVNRSVIDRSVDRYMLMHAAAACRSGITVVLAADMERGKTTTVAGLLRDGFDYVTDEAVAVDPTTGEVTPFPKTLSLDRGSWPLFPECRPADVGVPRMQWFVAPEGLGARVSRPRVGAPRVILFPSYVKGATTEVLPVNRSAAVHELARMTFDFARHPRRNLDTAVRLVRGATVAHLRIGDLQQAVVAIEELVSQRILEDL